MTATRARLDVGDPLRALAALGVFGLHAVNVALQRSGHLADLQTAPRDYFAVVWGPLGHVMNGLLVAVCVFFVLSAYLLSRPFLRSFVADEPLPSVLGYLRNRALRVLPVFWVVLALAIVFGPRGDSAGDLLGLGVLAGSFKAASLTAVLGQAWSLAVEARFYLLLPVAALALFGLKRVLGRRLPRGARIVLVLALVTAGFHASVAYARHDGPHFESFLANASFFAPGIVIALLEHVLPARVRARPWIPVVAPLVFAGGAVLLVFAYSIGTRVPGYLGRYLVPLATGAIVAGPLLWQWSGRPAWRVLDNAPLRWIGARSYPLFLVHLLVLYALAPVLSTGGYNVTLLVLGSASLLAGLVAADLLHRFVERPALRRKAPYAPPPAATRDAQATLESAPSPAAEYAPSSARGVL